MDAATARWLVSSDAAPHLAAAEAEPDPGSLPAAVRARERLDPARAAAVLDQAVLRRRARAKMGDDASRFFWTGRGLEQATRPAVARRRAERFLRLGAAEVVDLGCGCGVDAVAIQRAGPRVTAVELDEVTAILAAANLGAPPPAGPEGTSGGGRPNGAAAEVRIGDAEALAAGLLRQGAAAFCDPARRTAAGRTWRVEDFSPPWSFVLGLLDGSRPACAKLGPGLPLGLIPDSVEAEWVSDRGQVVEAALWAGPGTAAGRRRAAVGRHELVRDAALAPAPVGGLGEWLYEPDGAVIRAGLVPAIAEVVGGRRAHAGVAYLTAPGFVRTPFAEAFRVEEVLPYSEKALRAWVRANRIGVLEIKKRGIDVDPAALRRRLRLSGPRAATLILTPTVSGAVACVVTRAPTSAGPA